MVPSLIRIGLISDTHGLLRPQVHEVFAGVSQILHAGDVCSDTVLMELGMVAPTQAVFGNCDDPWDPALRESLDLTVGGLRIHVQHGHELGRPKPSEVAAASDADVCVYGHTHRQVIERVDGRLIINPGAAGPRRFDLKPCVALLTIADGLASAELIELAY